MTLYADDPINAIREGIAARLSTIDGLNVNPTEVGQIIAPAATVLVPDQVTYYQQGATFGGLVGNLMVPVMLNVGAQITDEASTALAGYAGWDGVNSVPAAVLADRTLGGIVADALVTTFRPFSIEEYAGVQFWGGIFTVMVLPPQ